ncbi:hypothetical protein ILYODFUR_024774 [Ilyodon furcidens]|uniref:Uncharacterized protein n=1 Tax=Ilyodon furcidens TaxID=33524 RepID=A0ABV0UAX1_9TELE
MLRFSTTIRTDNLKHYQNKKIIFLFVKISVEDEILSGTVEGFQTVATSKSNIAALHARLKLGVVSDVLHFMMNLSLPIHLQMFQCSPQNRTSLLYLYQPVDSFQVTGSDAEIAVSTTDL